MIISLKHWVRLGSNCRAKPRKRRAIAIRNPALPYHPRDKDSFSLETKTVDVVKRDGRKKNINEAVPFDLFIRYQVFFNYSLWVCSVWFFFLFTCCTWQKKRYLSIWDLFFCWNSYQFFSCIFSIETFSSTSRYNIVMAFSLEEYNVCIILIHSVDSSVSG